MTAIAVPEAKSVKVGAIEHELAKLWVQPAAGDGPATRALMANLIVFCRNDAQRADIEREVTAVVPHHPSRVLLLEADTGSDVTEVQAWVSTHDRAVGRERQVCGEQATIRASAAAVRALPSTVRAFLLGDIPTALWWATPDAPPLAGEIFTDLAELADQVIFDSFAWTDPLRQLVVTANWVTGRGAKVSSDLAWRRPRLWRRIIAQSMDPSLAPGALEEITDVRIEHGPHTLTQAWLLTGWLAFRLGWQPRGGKVLPGPEVSWSFEWAHGTPRVHIKRLPEGASEIRRIQVETKVSGRKVIFDFVMEAPGRISVRAEGLTDRQLSLTGPVRSRGELVARQLPDLARDRLFEASIGLARTMAEAVL